MAKGIFFRRILSLFCGLMVLFTSAAARDDEPRWIRINSSHFSVVTDAGEKKGREVAVRFEQMRDLLAVMLVKSRLNLPEPLDIVALRSDEEYALIAPIRQGHPISAAGFFLPGEDRNYIVLNLSLEESWRAVSYEFARMFLNYNYPPTQAWFDEGFGQYFAGVRVGDKQIQVGSDPGVDNSAAGSATKSLVQVLNGQTWLSLPQVFSTKPDASTGSDGPGDTIFSAQSWIVMHYLINKNKLSETGKYFDLVQNQKTPVEQAIQQAYEMTPAQMEQAIKEYFHYLAPQTSTAEDTGNIGTSRIDISEADGPALLAEVAVRLPEHREQAVKQLEVMVGQPKTETAIAHRALAFADMQAGKYDDATEELTRAAELDAQDPWVHYYLALVKYHAAQATGQLFHGLANMMQDLRVVLDWKPDFAEAYSMLSMARVEGGGVNSAMESMRAAIRLAPRNEEYLLNMAHIYMAGKNWDAATQLLQGLKNSQNPAIAKIVKQDLADLPTLRKYGLLPQRDVQPAPAASTATKPAVSKAAVPSKADAGAKPTSDDSEDEGRPPAEPVRDTRVPKFAKGKLLSVDCTQPPSAIVTVVIGAKTMKLRTEDYKSLPLVGQDEFSCEWRARPVAVNYKAGGKADGDLVSLEVQ